MSANAQTRCGDGTQDEVPEATREPVAARSYQCYLRDRFGIATVEIIECADEDEAKQRAREILARNGDRYRAVEVWYRERQIYLFPSDAERPPVAARRRSL